MTPDALLQSLTQPWAHGEHLDAAGAVFDAPVVLDGLTLRSFDLSGAQFRGGLSARGTRFRGMAWFQGATITGTLDLTDAGFHTDLRLDGLVTDRLILDRARFEGVLTLDRARIATLSARDCLCLANLSLGGAIVTERADLSGAVVMGGLWADSAALHGLDLSGAEIDGRQRGI